MLNSLHVAQRPTSQRGWRFALPPGASRGVRPAGARRPTHAGRRRGARVSWRAPCRGNRVAVCTRCTQTVRLNALYIYLSSSHSNEVQTLTSESEPVSLHPHSRPARWPPTLWTPRAQDARTGSHPSAPGSLPSRAQSNGPSAIIRTRTPQGPPAGRWAWTRGDAGHVLQSCPKPLLLHTSCLSPG